MHTIQLKINDKVYDKFIWLLSKFNKEEIEIVSETSDFKSTQNYLQKELEEIESGKANFLSQQDFENRLNNIVQQFSMKIIYKDTFTERLEKQLKYLKKNSPKSALKLKTGLVKRIKTIPENPYLFRKSIYFENDLIRDLIYNGYTVVFRINETQIEIFGFTRFQEKPTD